MTEAAMEGQTLRIMSWNMGHGGPNQKKADWEDVVARGTERGADVALLQEAPNPHWYSLDRETIPPSGSFWRIEGINRARTAILPLSGRVKVEEIPTRPLALAGDTELAVSRLGTITAAKVTVIETNETIVVVSIYAQWEGPFVGGDLIFSDASMHRILSDLSPLLTARQFPVVVAGDFNTIYGSEDDSPHGNWTERTAGIWSRAHDLDLRFKGPQHPAGEKADPRPWDLPEDTDNVPTHETRAGNKSNQLDYVLVTPDLDHRTTTQALNSQDDWGESDHCRILIEIKPHSERMWTAESFLAELKAKDPLVSNTAQPLLDWGEQPDLTTYFSRGVPCQWSAYVRDEQPTFWLSSDGRITIPFQWYQRPFADPEDRRSLTQALAEIPGMDIPDDRLNGRPTFHLRVLADPEHRDRFLAVMDRVITETIAARRAET